MFWFDLFSSTIFLLTVLIDNFSCLFFCWCFSCVSYKFLLNVVLNKIWEYFLFGCLELVDILGMSLRHKTDHERVILMIVWLLFQLQFQQLKEFGWLWISYLRSIQNSLWICWYQWDLRLGYRDCWLKTAHILDFMPYSVNLKYSNSVAAFCEIRGAIKKVHGVHFLDKGGIPNECDFWLSTGSSLQGSTKMMKCRGQSINMDMNIAGDIFLIFLNHTYCQFV